MDFRLVEANLRQSFRILAEGRAGADVLELPGLSIASLGVAFQMFNTAFLSSPVLTQSDLEARLEQAQRHFQSRGRAWAFWICEDWIDGRIRRNLTQTFQRFGLRLSSEMPGMIAEPRLAALKRQLPALEIRRVNSESVLNDFRAIGSVSFHVPYTWFSEVFDLTLPTGRTAFACYVGYLRGEPIATAASVCCDGVTGLYNIATAPAYRRRGYGEAMARSTIELAGNPARVVLQSTSQGLRMYERMGFRTVSAILVYNSM